MSESKNTKINIQMEILLKPILNTTDPNCMIYQTEELTLTILGGIRIEHLDRMRVTLKLEVHNRKYKQYIENPEVCDLAMRHNVDLYNDLQVEKFIRRAAERMEIGVSALTKAIADLTGQLEGYRMEALQKTEPPKPTYKILSEKESQEAKLYLSSPNLMERTKADIGRSGVIGEETNRLLMYLIFTSRKRDHPLHVVSLGNSGVGKSHLQEKVGELIPEEEKYEITTLTENAFYYFGQQELKHKLLLIEDLDGAEGALYPLRELQSKKKIIKTITIKDGKGQTKTVSLTVEGPVSVGGCTTKESIYEDNANRSFLLYIDESKEQDEKIMSYQRKCSAGKTNREEENQLKELFKNAQRLLKKVTIVNPYAEYLQLPAEVFKPRRTNAHYLAFIEAVTFYHQYQREEKPDLETGEVYIETSVEDIEEANKLMVEILLRKSDELNKATRSHFEKLKAYLQNTAQASFVASEIRQAFRENYSNQKRYMQELLQNGYVERISGSASKGFTYALTAQQAYENLQSKITGILSGIIETIQGVQSSSSVVVQTGNGLPKVQKTSKKNTVVQKSTESISSPENNPHTGA